MDCVLVIDDVSDGVAVELPETVCVEVERCDGDIVAVGLVVEIWVDVADSVDDCVWLGESDELGVTY